ncbi:putative RNA-directed DNA polymerase from transposon X-element [Araneus ventricosus]|uniref:Putative RNA-directed DNA polymerase from transposon X-element n=1 Tax=Araneus ventricosus TaxID=182803 RepID=A0A4Y2WLY5_ARAVE|nr:putative RNA-directed DNA polymerase from transposon X-element [Araneus ventricosus]
MPRGKAPGYDGIDNIIVHTIHKKFPILFTTFFNKCLQLGLYPDPFKIGTIVLFQKPGKNIHETSAYRPIALLPSMAKVLEKLMTQRLIYHLERNNMLSENQYGFRGEDLSTQHLTASSHK